MSSSLWPPLPWHHWPPHCALAAARPAAPVVALHGFTGSGEDWADLAAGWPDRAWWAPDLPGHGAAAEYRWPTPAWPWVPPLPAPLFSTGQRPWLVGYSMGARLALSWAVVDPARWAGLILIGATAGLEDAAEAAARRASDAALAETIAHQGVPAFLEQWQRQPLLASLGQRAPAAWQAARRLRQQTLTAMGLAASLRHHGTGAMPPLWSHLEGLHCPVAVVVGANDTKFIALGQRLAQALPNATLLVVPGAGHAPAFEAPADFHAVLDPWWRQWANAGE